MNSKQHFRGKKSIICIMILFFIVKPVFSDTLHNTQIDISNLTILQKFSNPILSNFLLKYFCFDSNWEVTEELGAIVAYARKTSPIIAKLSKNEKNQVRITFRFGPYTRYVPYLKWPHFSILEISEKTGTIKVTENASQYGSLVFIKSGSLFLQITEWSNVVDRIITKQVIKNISVMLQNVFQCYTTDNSFYKLLPPNSMIEADKNSINIKEQDVGIYNVSGYINPMEQGFITLQVIDKQTNKDIGSPEQKTIEYVGWSSNKNERFYWEKQLTIYGKPLGGKKKVQLEVIFHPTGKKVLLRTEKEVRTWTR